MRRLFLDCGTGSSAVSAWSGVLTLLSPTAVRRGDRDVLDRLCDRLYGQVRSIVHAALDRDVRSSRPWLGALLSTGDIVQEVFMSALAGVASFDGKTEAEFVAYLAKATQSRLIDAIRFHEAIRRDRRRVRGSLADVGPAGRDDDPVSIAANMEQVRRFWDALQSLSERNQHLVRRRLEDRTPFDQLAIEYGFASADSARKTFYTAQARVLARLAGDGELS